MKNNEITNLIETAKLNRKRRNSIANSEDKIAAKQQDKQRNRRVELQIKEELARSSSNLSLDSQSVSEIHSKLNQIVDDYTNKGIEIFTDAKNNSTFKTDKKGWKELEDFDRSVVCPEEGCNHIILKNDASNTVEFWEDTQGKIIQFLQVKGEKIGITNNLDEIKNIVKELVHLDSGEICPELGRGIIWHTLLKETEKHFIMVGDHKIDISDFLNDENQELNNKPFTELELKAIESLDIDAAIICHRLNMCATKKLTCPSGHSLFESELSDPSFDKYDFTNSVKFAIDSCIRTIIGNAVNRPPKSFIARDKDNNKIEIFRGVISGKGGQRIKRAIAESVMISTQVNGPLVINYANENEDSGLTIYPEDNTMNKIYSAISSNVVKELASHIKTLKPLVFFLEEGKGRVEQEEWAGDRAIDILHAFNKRRFVIQDELSSDFDYNDGGQPVNETNMLNLTNEILEIINSKFLEHLDDGKVVNTLELLLNQDTTPPMLCEPISRLSHSNTDNLLGDIFQELNIGNMVENNSGGFITQHMRNRFPLISNNSMEELFNRVRFIPSHEAIKALDYLQETEWTIDDKLVSIVKTTLKQYVDENITKLFTLRKKNTKQTTAKLQFEKNFRVLKLTENSVEIDWKQISADASQSWEKLEDNEKQEWEVRANIENAKEIICIDMDAYPRLTLGQINMWYSSLNFVDLLKEEFESKDRKFWHAWSFDWRGRMVTCSTILSPQNDDFARGLLRFANKIELNQNGWIWLQRHTAALMRGRNIPNDCTLFSDEEKEQWAEVLELLSDKSHANQDKAVTKDCFHKILQKISNDPVKYNQIWAEGDIFRAKAEGFQRISAIIAYVEAKNKGGKGAYVNLPISLDASSSIYQQASLLVRDRSMAELVNVVPTGEVPADIYQKVIDQMELDWNENCPFSEFLTDDEIGNLKNSVLDRKISKKPVMTIGYGAHRNSMITSLLTHNGQNSGLVGGWIPIFKDSSEKVEYPDITDSREFNWRKVAHPSSILFDALCSIDEANHEKIAKIIIDSLLKAVEEVIPGFNKMIGALQTIVEKIGNEQLTWQLKDEIVVKNIQLKKLKPISKESSESFEGIAGKARRLVNTKIGNLYNKYDIQSETDVMKIIPSDLMAEVCWERIPELTEEINQKSNNNEKEELNELINSLKNAETERIKNFKQSLSNLSLDEKRLFYHMHKIELQKQGKEKKEIQSALDQAWENKTQELENEFKFRIATLKENCVEDNDDGIPQINWEIFRNAVGLESNKQPVTEKHEFNQLHKKVSKLLRNLRENPCTFSRQQLIAIDDKKREKTSIAPNFVHSHDACHMRLVALDLSNQQIDDFWSVHDAFGSHPNFIENIRISVKKQLIETHFEDEEGKSTLDRLARKHLDIEDICGDLELEEVGSEFLVY